jgi:putative ABC transport system permease protein
MGFVLVWLFEQDSWWVSAPAMLFMLLFATYTADAQSGLFRGFWIALAVLFLASGIILVSLLLFGAVKGVTREVIPMAGMIIGNALNVYTLTINRLKSDIRLRIDEIEAKSALGETLKSALHGAMKQAVKAAMIPILNNLNTVGLVLIPGVTVGMLLAGADPMDAVMYQLVIMYMMVGVSVFAGIFTVTFAYRAVMATVFAKR